MFKFICRCGFFRINGESVVPYTMKEGVKYVPLFYFEGETDHLKLKSDKVDGWDLAYLKFCCKVQVRMHCCLVKFALALNIIILENYQAMLW